MRSLQEVPSLLLNDKALIVSVAKVAGLLPLSAEMQSDAAVNITTWVNGALADSLSRDLDLGLLRGTGKPQPNGIIAQADPVDGPTLIAAAGAAIAAIGEAGGTTNTIAMSPTVYAAELTRTDDLGHLVHPDGLPDLIGLGIVQVPGLDPPLVYDSGRCFLVLGQDCNVTIHDDPHHDASCCWSRPGRTSGCRSRTRRSASWTSPSLTRAQGGAASGQDQMTTSPPPWEAWAPPLNPPAAGGLPVDQAQAIADAWWEEDPHLGAALMWESYAATLPDPRSQPGRHRCPVGQLQPGPASRGLRAGAGQGCLAQVVHHRRVRAPGGSPA